MGFFSRLFGRSEDPDAGSAVDALATAALKGDTALARSAIELGADVDAIGHAGGRKGVGNRIASHVAIDNLGVWADIRRSLGLESSLITR